LVEILGTVGDQKSLLLPLPYKATLYCLSHHHFMMSKNHYLIMLMCMHVFPREMKSHVYIPHCINRSSNINRQQFNQSI